MAFKELHRVKILEVIRRWQAGGGQLSKATGTGLSRETVRRYLEAVREAGVVQEGPAPTEGQLSVLASVSRSGPQTGEASSEELLAPWQCSRRLIQSPNVRHSERGDETDCTQYRAVDQQSSRSSYDSRQRSDTHVAYRGESDAQHPGTHGAPPFLVGHKLLH